jgi:hypothetical protein
MYYDLVSRGRFVAVRLKRRFVLCEIGSISLDPLNQVLWIDATVRIELARLLEP